MPKDEFTDADATFGKTETAIVTVAEQVGTSISPSRDMFEHRSKLIAKYYAGANGLANKLLKEGRDNSEMLVMALVDEVIKETDSLLGNELVATEQGDLRDATIISAKRAEVLEKAIKAVQTKQLFDRDGGGIDVKGPAMKVVMKFFMKKVKEVFKRMAMRDEMSDTFFRHLGDVMEGWEKEMAADLEELNSLRPNVNG